jgi:hypothetical protein
MNQLSIPQHPVLRLFPPGVERRAGCSRNAAPSRTPVTMASTERLLASFTTRNKDAEILRNFQYVLLITVADWQRCMGTRDI